MAEIHKPLDILIGLEKIKVWSLIVTLFGDLDSISSQSLSGKQINNLLGFIGIKPEATRVALHRLKNEDWINTSKSGRETIYQMSDKARYETSSVYGDVYGSSVKYPEGWKLVITPDHEDAENIIAIAVMKNILLMPITSQHHTHKIIQAEFKTKNIPDWFAEKIISPSVLETASKLKTTAEMPLPQTTKLNEAALRLLILHHWRKLALRDSVWCYISLMPNSILSHCHNSVSQFLQNTPNINPHILTD